MVKIPRKRNRLHRIAFDPLPYDVTIAVFGCLGSGIAAYKLYEDNQLVFSTVAVVLAGLALVVGVSKHFVIYFTKEKHDSLHDLAGCLRTLWKILEAEGAKADPGLRITIHVPIEGGRQLEQAMDYIGCQRRKNTAGRRFHANCGIIGIAFSRKQECIGTRSATKYEAYIKELKEVWCYSEPDARSLDQATKSWMAVPIKADGKGSEILGILYADSTEPAYFTKKMLSTTVLASRGIADYVVARYK